MLRNIVACLIRYFRDIIYNDKTSKDEAKINQSSLLDVLTDFKDISRPKTAEGKIKKEILIKVHMLFMKFENCFQKWNIYNKKNTRKRIKNMNS